MLDLRYLIDNFNLVRKNCVDRNCPESVHDDLNRLVTLSEREWKPLIRTVEQIRQEQNRNAQATGKEKDSTKRAELVATGKRLKHDVAEHEENLRTLEAELNRLLSRIPNLTHPDAPIGHSEADSRELRNVGTPRAFDFEPKDHVEIGKALDLIDFESG